VLPRENIFFDVNTIAGGENFEKKIELAIEKSDAVLIFIGDKWVKPAPETGQVRLLEAVDYVRAEVRAALARPILVLPILVGGASMPKPDQLPEDIRPVVKLNTLPLRHDSFDDDTENILALIFGSTAKERLWEPTKPHWIDAWYAICGVLASWIFLLLIAVVHSWALRRPLEASIGLPLEYLAMAVVSILGGWIGWMYGRRRSPPKRPQEA
jgi:hypothetical protein